MAAYNEKLCDERHEFIERRLGHLTTIGIGILVLTALSIVIGVTTGNPALTTTTANVITGMIK
jgi:hypothetical protein